MMSMNIIHSAHSCNVPRLLFLGSTCIYPRMAEQPIKEESLLTSSLEPTNEGYALAKIASLKLCSYYRKQFNRLYHSIMPTNLYGPGDNYHISNSHVLPAMIRKFEDAILNNQDSVTIWGTGKPFREFLHVQDLANAILFLLKEKDPPDWVNIGSSEEISIKDLAEKIKSITGFNGKIIFDASMPDGTPRKVCDSTIIRNLGWAPSISLEDGIKQTVNDYKNNKNNRRN